MALASLAGSANVSLARNAADAGLAAPSGKWRVLDRATDAGDLVAVAAAAKRRTTRLAVRVRVGRQPKTAELHTVVTCSTTDAFGFRISALKEIHTLTAPAMRVLRLPFLYPENCGVTVIGVAESPQMGVGDSITVEILAPCIVQRNGHCI